MFKKQKKQINMQIRISVVCWDKFSLGPICEAAGPDSPPLSFEYIPLFIKRILSQKCRNAQRSHTFIQRVFQMFPKISNDQRRAGAVLSDSLGNVSDMVIFFN